MAKDYLCLSCGYKYAETSNSKCPRCGSSYTLSLKPENLYKLFSGGG